MKCIAIDDEPIALAIIRQYCERRGGMELETYSNSKLGMQRVMETRPDLVFLDIELNGVSGIELAKGLPKECCLVFTTAYAQYALDGFEVNALDFLHKPFFYNRFERAVQKAENWLRMNRLIVLSEMSQRKIMLKSEYKNVAVLIDDILYVEAMDNYVKVFRMNQPTVVSQISLKNLIQALPENDFIRVHRSYVVAVKKVSRFTKQQLTLTDASVQIPVGRMYADEVFKILTAMNGASEN